MNVARLNMSHGTPEYHAEIVNRVREAAKQTNKTIAIMVDTRGREIRTGKVEDGEVELKPGDSFTLYGDSRLGDSNGVSITIPDLVQHARLDDRILIDDGTIGTNCNWN